MHSDGFVGAMVGMYAETGESLVQKIGKATPDTPDGIIGQDIFNQAYGDGVASQNLTSAKIGDGRALRVTVPSPTPNPWDAFIAAPHPTGNISVGYKVTLTFWARATGGPGEISVMIQRTAAPYESIVGKSFSLTPHWQEYVLEGRSAFNFAGNQMGVVIHLGEAAQTIEIGNYKIEKFAN